MHSSLPKGTSFVFLFYALDCCSSPVFSNTEQETWLLIPKNLPFPMAQEKNEEEEHRLKDLCTPVTCGGSHLHILVPVEKGKVLGVCKWEL